MTHDMSEKQRKIFGVVAIVVFAAVSVLFIVFAGKPIIEFASEPEQFRAWVREYGVWGMLGFVGMVFLQTFFAFIPGEPFELVAGYAFGSIPGLLLCIAGEVLGSVAVFAFVRYFGMKVVEIFFSKEKIRELKFLKETEKRDVIFFIIFMLPGTPKDILCYFAGLVDMKWRTWLIICSVGRIPSVITSTLGGNAMNQQNYGFAVLVFGVTLALSGAGLLIYKTICRRRSEKVQEENENERREN